ncbi:MAG TPA: BatA domain-containing protein [Steroidobacteraceae bacterium]|nr:BatA domain-containing protein [Steroidobacteraceae bacterium]
MGFLAPGFLLGALAVGLPLYLHLLRRQSGVPRPFSSLMFFERRLPVAAHRRRLRYLLLLAARIAVILLVALAFAEPFIPGSLAGAGPERLLLLVIDDSFSMRAGARLDAAKRSALALVASKPSGERAQVLLLGAEVRALTSATEDPRVLRAAVEGIEPGDSRASFALLPGAVRAIGASAGAPLEVHLVSDMQRTQMPPSFSELAMPPNAALELQPVASGAAPNWAVESVTAPGQVFDLRTLRIQAVIAGYGTPAATRTATLIVNGRSVATRRVAVPASGRATVEFDAPELPYGLSRCAVRIDPADLLAADDEYLFSIERAERRRGLLVHQAADTRSALYFSAALRAADPSAFVISPVETANVAQEDPSAYAFVVLSDVAALPERFSARLADYVMRGGSVLIALGTAAAQQPRVPLIAVPPLAAHAYSRAPAGFAAVGEADATFPAVGRTADWDGVRFFYAAGLPVADARVLMRLTDGTPLLSERRFGEGRVMLFASGFDNLTNDLPLHPVFVAFVDRLARYLSGSEGRVSSHVVGESLALRSVRDPAVGVEVIDPHGHRPLSLGASTTAESLPLTIAGFYEVDFANGRQDVIAVNPDRRESDLAPVPRDVLALWRGAAAVPGATTAHGAPRLRATAPYDLWWYAMTVLLAVCVAESALASRYLGTPREGP